MNQPSKIDALLVEVEEPSCHLAYIEHDGQSMLDHLARRSTHTQWIVIENFISSANPGDNITVYLDNKRDALLIRIH